MLKTRMLRLSTNLLKTMTLHPGWSSKVRRKWTSARRQSFSLGAWLSKLSWQTSLMSNAPKSCLSNWQKPSRSSRRVCRGTKLEITAPGPMRCLSGKPRQTNVKGSTHSLSRSPWAVTRSAKREEACQFLKTRTLDSVHNNARLFQCSKTTNWTTCWNGWSRTLHLLAHMRAFTRSLSPFAA